jgi:hypothetical protein
MRQTYCLEDTITIYVIFSAQMNIKHSEQNSQPNPYQSCSLTLMLELLNLTVVNPYF